MIIISVLYEYIKIIYFTLARLDEYSINFIYYKLKKKNFFY